jgi:hypothetical protein
MSYSAICEALQKERMAKDKLDAAHAKEEYGDRFDAAFTYRRGGQLLVMNKAAAIAKHYHILHKSD